MRAPTTEKMATLIAALSVLSSNSAKPTASNAPMAIDNAGVPIALPMSVKNPADVTGVAAWTSPKYAGLARASTTGAVIAPASNPAAATLTTIAVTGTVMEPDEVEPPMVTPRLTVANAIEPPRTMPTIPSQPNA